MDTLIRPNKGSASTATRPPARRLSMTVALIVAVVGEMLASQPGLGQAILLAARSFRASELFAGIVLLGAVGFVTNAALAVAQSHLLKYQRS